MPDECVLTSVVPHLHYPFERFNPAQSLVVPHKDEDVNIVCAFKTGSGKTICAELIMDSVLQQGKKAIYTSPLKALSQEKYDDWTSSKHAFSKYGISILTGDYRLTEARKKDLQSSNIIIMTSEMADSYPYDTKVWCYKNGKVWREKIGKIVEQDIDCEVFSHHQGIGIRPTPITGRVRIGAKPVFKVTLAGGREVEMTKCHNLFIKDGEKIKTTPLKNLKKGDNVAVACGFVTPSDKSEIDLLSICKNLTAKKKRTVFVSGEAINKIFQLKTCDLHRICRLGSRGEPSPEGTSRRRWAWEKRGCVPLFRIEKAILNKEILESEISRIRLYHSKMSFPRIIKIDPELAWAIGFYTAEGCVSQNHISITQKTKPFLLRAKKALGGVIRKGVNGQGRKFYYLDIGNILLSHIFASFGPVAHKKHIPEFIFSWRLKEIESFLKGFYAGDGSACHKGERYHTSSKQLAKDVQDLFFLCGDIPARNQARKKDENQSGMWVITKWNDTKQRYCALTNELKNLTFRSIKSIKYVGTRPVYDLEVDPSCTPYEVQNFVGGQGAILLHNSRCKRMEAEKNDWLYEVGVFVNDESNLLGTEGRGAAVECGLMKFTELNPKARLVFLSATIGNSKEIAEWASLLNGKNTVHMRSDYRPCPLRVHYVDYEDTGRYADKERAKVKKALEVLEANDKDHFLIFVHGKEVGNKFLTELKSLGYKAEFHNADLEKEKRMEVESAFRKGEIDHLVATSTLAYGVNLPARRVLVLGVNRGMKPVEPMDIIQEFGRAGRPGYDTEGDAYLLVPHTKMQRWKKAIETEPIINSQMLDSTVLAFHLISAIERKEVQSVADIHKWYERSFAKFQGTHLKDDVIDEVIDRLEKIDAIRLVNGVYECQVIGRVASWFYQSPFDVAAWKDNFTKVFKHTSNPDELDMAWAITHVDSITSKLWPNKEDEMEAMKLDRECMYRGYYFKRQAATVVKGLISHLKGHGLPVKGRAGIYQIVFDAERIIDTIKTAGSYTKAYNPDGKVWDIMCLRLQTGASKEMVPLVQLEGVGVKRAGALLKAQIKSPMEVIANATRVKQILGDKIGDHVIDAANKLVRNPKANIVST
jgi:replicative superfamily II helicase/intein/homing endonuclease